MTDLLELALDDLVPSFVDAQPDWADVAARARRETTAHRRRLDWRGHPRRAVALALAVLVVVVLATPALGVQGYVLHLLGRKNVSFGNSPSAPNVVKKQFLDMPVGAPPEWSTPVRAAQARVVGTFRIAGHPRRLWVAPTVKGGFCYMFEKSFGGCRLTRDDRALEKPGAFGVTWQGGSARAHVNESIVTRVGGDITAPGAAKITASYLDGSAADIPFVWVSAPVAAGFYSYDIPTAHWAKAHRLRYLTLYAANGRVLDRQSFPYQAHPRRIGPLARPRAVTPKTRLLPTAPAVAPSAPVQSGAADGFRVEVGHNGAVQFVQIGATPILNELQGHSAGYGCFRLTKEFGIFTARGLSQGGRFASKVGFTLAGVGTPVDGCEVQASIGRTWPDRLHNHAAVEIPLSAKGKQYFTDRAAARDLALFTRSRRMQQLRKEPALKARADILRTYAKQLAGSPITVTAVDDRTLRLTEPSATGRTFTVTVRNGRITAQNLKPYALVF